MSDHEERTHSLTEDAHPRTRLRVIADRDLDQDQGSNPSSAAENLSSALQDRRYAPKTENSACCEASDEIARVQAAVAVDIQNLQTDLVAKNREIGRLKRELSEVIDEDSPEAQSVRALLDLWWREVKGSDSRVKHDLQSTRAPKVRKALKRRGVEMCQKAILGVLHDDWAMGRVAKSGGKDFNDIAEHVLHSDATIEKFAKLHDQHAQAGEKPAWATEPDRDAAFVRYVYGEDCKLPLSTTASRPPKPRDEFTVPPVDKVIPALHAAGCELKTNSSDPDRWYGKCPAHDDRSPSLQVWRTSDGRMRMKCWTGCREDDILAAARLEHADCWRGSEYDTNSRAYAGDMPPFKYKIPPDLRHTMERMLAENERMLAEQEGRAA